MYYPGDDYVDIVALDVYVDDPVRLKTLLFIIFKYGKQFSCF
jgi:beta-mannanase